MGVPTRGPGGTHQAGRQQWGYETLLGTGDRGSGKGHVLDARQVGTTDVTVSGVKLENLEGQAGRDRAGHVVIAGKQNPAHHWDGGLVRQQATP